MFIRLRVWVVDHPTHIRATVAGALALAGQLIPGVREWVGSDVVVDVATGALLALLGVDAVRMSAPARFK